MQMQIIRIAGASYSGSTALGHFLNTANGVLFGSELYRLLPVFQRSKGASQPTPCDHCGMDCHIWSSDFRTAIDARPGSSLADVYDLFFASVPNTRILVDGSKSLRWYDYGRRPQQALSYVVSAKHPIRLLASFFYNDKGLIPAQTRATLEDSSSFLDERLQSSVERAQEVLTRLLDEYRSLFAFVDGREPHMLCRVDIRADVLTTLARLAREHGLEVQPSAMARTACHAIGGNRSVRWQLDDFAHGPGKPQQDRARFNYYRSQASDFHRQDNKHLHLFSARLRTCIQRLPQFHALTELLGYEVQQDADSLA